MAGNKSKHKAKRNDAYAGEAADDVRQLTDDLARCLKRYARENPGTAALCCLGVGFVLGWKLKPW